MTRYASMFDRLESEVAFVPFLVLGDPDAETSFELIRALIRGGADALELGIPFSDPVADGPVIQAAATRALAGGARIDDAWSLLASIRDDHSDIPIGLLTYANLVLNRTPESFYRSAHESGVDSVLIADLPLQETASVDSVALEHGVAPVHIAPPNADDAKLKAIAEASRGYVYVTSRPGVTGVDDTLHGDSAALIAKLKRFGAPPAMLGFGIARPAHVVQAGRLGAAGAISGSAVVRLVERNLGDRPAMIASVEGFVREMKGATKERVG
jgi:tryptophan synthase alpha chain